MPTYAYYCTRCGAEAESYRTMDSRLDAPTCGRCCKPMELDFSATVQEQRVDCFHPYVEEHFGPKPVEVTSRAQRDQLCKDTGLTYDRMTTPPRPQRIPWERNMREYRDRAKADIARGRKVKVQPFSKEEQRAGTQFIDP